MLALQAKCLQAACRQSPVSAACLRATCRPPADKPTKQSFVCRQPAAPASTPGVYCFVAPFEITNTCLRGFSLAQNSTETFIIGQKFLIWGNQCSQHEKLNSKFRIPTHARFMRTLDLLRVYLMLITENL